MSKLLSVLKREKYKIFEEDVFGMADARSCSSGFFLNWKNIFFILSIFISHDVNADSKPGVKAPLWVPSICGRFEFSAWDKANLHPPYKLKFVVKNTVYVYTAEKLSSNTGSSPSANFPDDFVDASGDPARFSIPCVTGKLAYEIYADDARVESGEINVDFKVDD
ncbi:hypothetical protein [Pseudomonas gingeri]|uniref:hypothetical protein n=1 Tax=Pseudomonas gingeri TaxID=117681 RepID=UPI0015A42428|nr:hypothetical protein [Pseudomonas gingeri]NWA05926.1 hypothetical protein [Pseudomonas gingeri]